MIEQVLLLVKNTNNGGGTTAVELPHRLVVEAVYEYTGSAGWIAEVGI